MVLSARNDFVDWYVGRVQGMLHSNLCAGLFYYLCYSLIPRTFPLPSDLGTKLSLLEPSDEMDTGLMPLCGEKVCSNNNNCLLAINMIFNRKKVSLVLHSSSPFIPVVHSSSPVQ